MAGKGRRTWFSIEAKSFEISTEGDGRKMKVFITERSRGPVSWIHFGEEGIKNLLKGINICNRDTSQTRRVFDWKENGRSYSLECRENVAGRFLQCSVQT